MKNFTLLSSFKRISLKVSYVLYFNSLINTELRTHVHYLFESAYSSTHLQREFQPIISIRFI